MSGVKKYRVSIKVFGFAIQYLYEIDISISFIFFSERRKC